MCVPEVENKKVVLIVVVHADDFMVSGNETVCVKSCSVSLMTSSPFKSSGSWSSNRGTL